MKKKTNWTLVGVVVGVGALVITVVAVVADRNKTSTPTPQANPPTRQGRRGRH